MSLNVRGPRTVWAWALEVAQSVTVPPKDGLRPHRVAEPKSAFPDPRGALKDVLCVQPAAPEKVQPTGS